MAREQVQKRLFSTLGQSNNDSESLIQSSLKCTLQLFILWGSKSMTELFNNCAIHFSHLLNEWVGWHGFYCGFLFLFRSFLDQKSLQFSSEYTTPREFPEKHLSNWPQRKGYSATKPFTLGLKCSLGFLLIEQDCQQQEGLGYK